MFTIGHSSLPIERFIEALAAQAVTTLIDVRSTPYSRFAPQFNRETLQASLAASGIDYRFAGEYLGGRPKDPTCYRRGVVPGPNVNFLEEVDYDEVARRDWYKRGIDRLIALARAETVAIMCSEEDPAICHRRHLITKSLLPLAEVIDIRTSPAGQVRVMLSWMQPLQRRLAT